MKISVFLAATIAGATYAATASAQDMDQRSTIYVQAAHGDHRSYAVVVGMTRAWNSPAWKLGSGHVRGHWDLWLGGWSNQDVRGGRFNTPTLGIGPNLRWRAAQGTSAWFLEAGVAAMVTGKRLYGGDERMGTRFNFASHLGLGMNLGAQQAHELSLRLPHISNAGIKQPNPGLNSVLLRYAYAF